ncbi:hypothetical protein WAI453_010181 [Rhynchosporium graminicola]
MLSGFLESNYKKYKQDTSVFVRWLYKSGQKCGYSASPSGNVQSSDVPAKAPRLKGKARKLAKKGLSGK